MMTTAFATLLAVSSTLASAANLPRSAPPDPAPESSYRLAAQIEPAFGVGSGSFFTGLVGVRFDYRFSPEWSLGPYLGYANLKGPAGERVHNALVYLLLDYEAPLAGGFSMPLRLGAGYLPKNGPYLRTSVGLGAALADDWGLVGEVIPAFWSVDDRTEISLGVALELSNAF